MQSVKASPRTSFLQSKRPFIFLMILLILALAGWSAYNALIPAPAPSLPQIKEVLSQPVLAEQYGLGVNLIAVSAAGGMVDLRLHLIDSQKAKMLLGDPDNFPVLLADEDVVLRAAPEIAAQPVQFEDGSNLFVLYPNAQNVVKPGDPVNVVFGDLRLEAIPAK